GTVHPAVAVEDRVTGVRPGRGRDRGDAAEAAVHVVLVLEDLARHLERLDDLRVVERDLVLVPLVVDVRTGGTQDDVLDPVGARPAGGVARLHAGTPGARGSLVVLGDGRGEVHHLVPGLRDLVAGLFEHARRVPD